MKCTAFALTAMIGFAYAAPVPQESWIEPGGDHSYKTLTRRRFRFKKDADGRRIVDPIHMMLGSTVVGTAASFVALPLATRFWNGLLGVQESDGAKAARARIEKDAADAKAAKAKGAKRSVGVDLDDLDLTFDETRELYISSFVDTLLKENPIDGETAAAVCTGVGYRISDPSKTLYAAPFKFTAQGQNHEYDCFLLAGPVTFQVNNATDADFIWEASKGGATFSNGVLTIV